MKPELMRNWFVVQNGRQIDIHVVDAAEHREITVVADVRDEACATLIANAPRYKEALHNILKAGELAVDPKARSMFDFAFKGLGLDVQVKAQ